MDIRITSGTPTVDEARAIERAFAQFEAQSRADQVNASGARDAWTLSGRIAAHHAASNLRRL